MKKQRIVIIGGGLSGLTLAYLLEKKNYDITLIEASPRLGGRIQTAIGNLGTPMELGAICVLNISFFLSVSAQKKEFGKSPG